VERDYLQDFVSGMEDQLEQDAQDAEEAEQDYNEQENEDSEKEEEDDVSISFISMFLFSVPLCSSS